MRRVGKAQRAHHHKPSINGGHAEPVIGRAFARPGGFAHPTAPADRGASVDNSEQCLCGWRGRDRSYWTGHHTRDHPNASVTARFVRYTPPCLLPECRLLQPAAAAAPWKPAAPRWGARARPGRSTSFAGQQHERARTAAARLINADPSDVALIPSISYGVATAAKLLTIPRGTRVIVLENDHSSPVLEWHARAEAQGFTVETVRQPDDGDWTSAVLDSDRTIRCARRSASPRSPRCTGRTAG